MPSNSLDDIANRFCNEFLSQYERDEKGTYNCSWVTQQFTNWARKNGIDSKAIYLVWPDRPGGEAHIAPVVNNNILDFTIHQFDKSVKDCYKITPVSNWRSVYGKYGYGENYVDINGKRYTALVNTFDYFNKSKALGGQEGKAGLTIYPAKRLNDSFYNVMVDLLLEELKIVAPAVKLPSGKVIAGRKGDMHANVHDRIINRLAAINNVSQEAAANRFYKMYGEGKFKDGFVDNEGHFQTREDAWNIQKKYDKKIADRDVELSNKEGGDEFKRLASEWIPKEITGY